MMPVSEKDIELLIKMENVIGMNERKIFGRKKNKIVKFGDTKIGFDDFISYMNFVEKVITSYNKAKKMYEYEEV
jgi:hypothetical protein